MASKMVVDDESGRFRQRRRTRAAIVEAAMGLIADGKDPSVADIAEATDISRRTMYLHFPTLEHLLVDATLGLLSQQAVDEAIDATDVGATAEARVEAMVTALGQLAAESLPLGRRLIRLTVDPPTSGDAEPPPLVRGHRRIAWIEKALAPMRDQVDEAAFERLVSGLAMVIGWEALIVLHDLRGLDNDAQQDVSLWAAKALIAATLRERQAVADHH